MHWGNSCHSFTVDQKLQKSFQSLPGEELRKRYAQKYFVYKKKIFVGLIFIVKRAIQSFIKGGHELQWAQIPKRKIPDDHLSWPCWDRLNYLCRYKTRPRLLCLCLWRKKLNGAGACKDTSIWFQTTCLGTYRAKHMSSYKNGTNGRLCGQYLPYRVSSSLAI